MLNQAGVAFDVRAPEFDEDGSKEGFRGPPHDLARMLAEGKATSIGSDSDYWVIGSDSVVTVENRIFSKPRDRDEAAAHLRHFSGRTMLLASAVALARRGHVDWSLAETARLGSGDSVGGLREERSGHRRRFPGNRGRR